MARHGKSIAKQSEGRAGEKYLPVGVRCEKVTRNRGSTRPPYEEMHEQAWREHLDRSMREVGRVGVSLRQEAVDRAARKDSRSL